MKPKNKIIIPSILVLGGFVICFVFFFNHIVANRYIQYKMFRLIAFTLQRNLNITILFLLVALFILYMFWFLTVGKMKCNKDKTISFIVSFLIILVLMLAITWWFECHTGYTLVSALRKFYSNIEGVLTRTGSFDSFLDSLLKQSAVISVLAGSAIVVPVLFWLLTKLRWGEITAIIKPGHTIKTDCIRKITFALIIPLISVNLAIFIDSKINAPKGPNVIVLLIDALRKDHVGVYGYSRDTTPNIDRLSQEAVIFQDAVAPCSWTVPSVASLFSSLFPSVHGVNSYTGVWMGRFKADILDYEITTLAEVLKNKGYTTSAFVANHWITKNLQYNQGFDVFDSIGSEFKPRASKLNDKALPWIRKNRNKPFFAYLHYMDVHGPYEPLEPYASLFNSNRNRQMTADETSKLEYLSAGREKDKNNLYYYIDQYDGEIRYTDYHIGELLKRLQEYNLLRNTMIVITSDHGEAFFEHGFCDHGWSLYNEEIYIPLIIKFPESIKVGCNSQPRISLIDLTATILHILDCDFPYGTNGRELLHTLNDEMLSNRAVFSEKLAEHMLGPPKIVMLKRNFKAIYMVAEQKVTELYDLEKDPAEKMNLVSIYTDIVWECEKQIKVWLKEKQNERAKLGLEESSVLIEDQGAIERLKSLGYVQ